MFGQVFQIMFCKQRNGGNDMQQLPVDPNHEHKFVPGERVWTVQRDQVKPGFVATVMFELLRNQGTNILACSGYRLDIPNFNNSNDPTAYRVNEVYDRMSAAAEMAKWHEVAALSEQDWIRAIGLEGDEDGFEACELATGYPNSYEIRNLLHQCQQQGGLNERDRLQLRAEMEEHELDYAADPNDSRPILDKIMESFGLKVHVREILV
jgi:hypothetical protein